MNDRNVILKDFSPMIKCEPNNKASIYWNEHSLCISLFKTTCTGIGNYRRPVPKTDWVKKTQGLLLSTSTIQATSNKATVKIHRHISLHKWDAGGKQRNGQTFHVLTDQQHLQNLVQLHVSQFKKNISKMIFRKMYGLETMLKNICLKDLEDLKWR